MKYAHTEEYTNDTIIMKVKTNAENEVTYVFKTNTCYQANGTYINLDEKGFEDLCAMIDEYKRIKEAKE